MIILALVIVLTNAAEVISTEGQSGGRLLGNYGYVTRYDLEPAEARAAVREMFSTYGVREVQFYDVVYRYSAAMPGPGAATWVTKASTCFTGTSRTVRRDTVLAYTDEIRRLGGRSWMYVQAVGADEPASDLPGSQPYLNKARKQITWLKNSAYPCLYVYHPTAAWGKRMAEIWGVAAAELGFSGIHWDQLGKQSDDDQQNQWLAGNVSVYLRTTRPLLAQRNLSQSFNFVDGFGWDPSLYTPPSAAAATTIEFPYWETWSDAAEKRYFDTSLPGAVWARYPAPGCCGNPAGFSADILMEVRFNKSAQACGSYILVGDGNRRLVKDYWPAAVPMTAAEASVIKAIAKTEQPQCQRTLHKTVDMSSSLSSQQCTLSAGFDCVGGDISHRSMSTVTMCCTLCSQTTGCTAFSFAKYDGTGKLDPTCYL